jgi:tetratricopeptide (TPR) repeat protein
LNPALTDPLADSSAERHLRHGLAARQLGDFSAARRHYLEAALLRPGDTALAVDAAATCLAAQDVTGAAALLKGRRAEGLPDELGARLLFAQGLVLKRMRHPDEASTCFQGSLSRGASTPGLFRQVRREWSDTLLNSLGDPRAAARLYGPAGAELDVIPARSSDARYADDEHAWLTRLVAGLYSGDIECAPLVEGFKAFAARHLVPLEGLASLQRTSRQVRPGLGRVRIGFISNQFCSSPVGFLTLATLEALALLADLVFFDRGATQDWAQKVVAAFASSGKVGVATLDGKMLDMPHLRLAKKIIAAAQLA